MSNFISINTLLVDSVLKQIDDRFHLRILKFL